MWKNGYYYRQRWQGGTCTTEYVGSGETASLIAQFDEIEQENRRADLEAFRRMVADERAIDREIGVIGVQVRDLLTLAMVATGHRQHKRQWRKDRMAETTAIQMQLPTESYLSADELNAVIQAIDTKRPTKQQRAEFMRHLNALPKLAKLLGDAQEAITIRLVESVYGEGAGSIAARVHLDNLRSDFGYDGAPVLEQMLIEHILIAWLRLQQAEWRNLNATLGEHSFRLGDYWERRLSAAQSRYLRAVETLARVRRLNLKIQVNMANHQIVT